MGGSNGITVIHWNTAAASQCHLTVRITSEKLHLGMGIGLARDRRMIINIMPLDQNKPFFWKDRRCQFKGTKATCFLKRPHFAVHVCICLFLSLSSYPYICKHPLFLSSSSRRMKWPIGKMPIHEPSWHKNVSSQQFQVYTAEAVAKE